MNDHQDARAGAQKGLDLKLLRREKETRFERCELRKREIKMRDEKHVEGGRKNNTKHSKETSCSMKQDRLEPTSPSNVTQAAVHKERWREQITHEKKKYIYIE